MSNSELYIDWEWWYKRYRSVSYFIGFTLFSIGASRTFNEFLCWIGVGIVSWAFVKSFEKIK